MSEESKGITQADATDNSSASTHAPASATPEHSTGDSGPAESKEKSEGGAAVEGKEGGGPKTEVLEKGHLYFFYRPKVDAHEVKSPDDVQKFYLLMSPDGAEGRPAREEELEGKRGEERTPLEHQGKALHRLLVLPVSATPHLHPSLGSLCPSTQPLRRLAPLCVSAGSRCPTPVRCSVVPGHSSRR